MTTLFNKSAFTLIELLVVVLIIGILSAIALPQYQKAVLKNRAVQMQVLADALRTAQRVYYLANGKYAQKFEELDIQLPAGATITPFGDTEQATYSNNMKAYLFINSEASYVLSGNKYGIGIHSLFRGGHKCQSFSAMADQVCLSLGGKYIGTFCETAENLAAGAHGCNLYSFE